MKMLIKERAQVNLSFGIILDLLECHSGHSGNFLHDQICNQFDSHHNIDSFSAPGAHSVNLKVILKPSPELLNGVVLLPDGDGFTSSQLPSEDHETFELGAIHEEHQYHFAESWAFCFLSGYWYTFASPGRIIQLYLLLVQRKLLFLTIDSKHIVAFCMNQYLVKAFFSKYLDQVARAIPAIEGDRELVQVNPFLLKQFHYRMDHLPEYLWLGCVTPTLLATDTQRYDPFTYLDGYGYDVLTIYRMTVPSTEPAIGKAYELAHPVYNSVIHTQSNPHPGECCWTFGKRFSYKLLCLGEPSIQEHLSQMIYAPGVDSVIDFVLVKPKSLYKLIGCKYVEHMSISQHQQNLHRFMLASCEVSVEKLLKQLNDFVDLIYHTYLPMGLLAFSSDITYKEALFSVYCQGFMTFSLTSREFSVRT
jgi:hypothetical protein